MCTSVVIASCPALIPEGHLMAQARLWSRTKPYHLLRLRQETTAPHTDGGFSTSSRCSFQTAAAAILGMAGEGWQSVAVAPGRHREIPALPRTFRASSPGENRNFPLQHQGNDFGLHPRPQGGAVPLGGKRGPAAAGVECSGGDLAGGGGRAPGCPGAAAGSRLARAWPAGGGAVGRHRPALRPRIHRVAGGLSFPLPRGQFRSTLRCGPTGALATCWTRCSARWA